MKQKLSKTEKTRRQAWREEIRADVSRPFSVTLKHDETPKALRVPKVKKSLAAVEAAPGADVTIRQFIKTTGPLRESVKRLTHKQAFEARVIKRAASKIDHPKRKSMKRKKKLKHAAKLLTDIAMMTYKDGSPVVCELGETAEQIHTRRLDELTKHIDAAEEER